MRPNILLIMSDSMDGRLMGCMGHPAAHTPHMDRLANQGVLFEQAYCNSPQCCPARASMWSGRYVHQVEAWNNYKGLSPDQSTWQTDLGAAGYRVNMIGKTDYVSGAHSLGARVTAWAASADIKVPGRVRRPQAQSGSGATAHEGDWDKVDRSLAWLNEHARDRSQPFLLYCGLNLPHPPFLTTDRWLELIDPDQVTLPPYEAEMHPVMDFMRVRKGCVGEFSDQEILAIRRTYEAMIAELDAMVGALLNRMDELGLWDSTYVIYLSDHGEMNMEHRMHLKNALYEPSARVPMIIAGPEVTPGRTVQELVSLIDLYPTLMDMAGISPPSHLEGCSLMPELTGGKTLDRPAWAFSEYHSNFQNTSSFLIRRGDWKYIAYPGYEPQLFNLAQDLDEMHSMTSSDPGTAQEMDAALRAIVDYPAVAEQVRTYNQESFRRWRAETDPQAYEQAMSTFFQGWGPELEAQIAAWLNEKPQH